MATGRRRYCDRRTVGTDPVAIDLPLWTGDAPNWAKDAWASIQETLPKDEDWEVWIDWYEERLRGGSRGEAYELVFASVPQEEWTKARRPRTVGSRTHLPKTPEAVGASSFRRRFRTSTPRSPMGGPRRSASRSSPARRTCRSIRTFPARRTIGSALEACRVGAERLLKALRDGRYNARPEYGEALEYYLDDLPKTAGAGNILLANDQVRILHAMFLADAAMLPEGFASRLKSVIANQFALNAFYDLVQRHNEAVSAGNWSQPFPLDAAKSFFGVVEDNTPRWFEREVEQGLRQVEQAEPPPAAPPEPRPRPRSSRRRCRRNARRAGLMEAPDGDGGERLVGDVSARPGHAGTAGRMAHGGGRTRRPRPADHRIPARARGAKGVEPTLLSCPRKRASSALDCSSGFPLTPE